MKRNYPIFNRRAQESKLSISIRAFADRVIDLPSPDEVIDELDRAVAPIGVRVLGAWRVPLNYTDWKEWKLGTNVFIHRDVPAKFLDEWMRRAKENGQSAIAARAARDGTPFTWSEAMRGLSGKSRWIFGFLLELGMRDGYCCPVGPWVLHYWSKRRLHLSRQARSTLYAAAVMAIEQLMVLTARLRLGGAPPRGILTARELEVLRLFAIGSRPQQIAHSLGISVRTARHHLDRAQRKLGATHPGHAVALAIRGALLAGAAIMPLVGDAAIGDDPIEPSIVFAAPAPGRRKH